MSWSGAEVMALASKAARGAGAPAGQAARFGQVAAAHLGAGRPASDLSVALADLPAGAILDYPLLLDTALAQIAAKADTPQPLPGDALMLSYVETLPFQAALTVDQQLTVAFETPRVPDAARRIVGCDVLIDQMQTLAARTFVPESDSSRQSGAGAGLLDND